MASPDSKTADDAFAQKVRAARESRSMTQEELAADMSRRGFDFHQQTVYKIESGRRKVTVGEGVAIADILRVPVDVLARTDPHSIPALRYRAVEYAAEALSSIGAMGEFAESALEHLATLRELAMEFDKVAEASGETFDVNGSASAFSHYWPLLTFQSSIDSYLDALGEDITTSPEVIRLIDALGLRYQWPEIDFESGTENG